MTIQYLKLEIFIPATHFRILQKTLQSADAGHIGNYDSCLSYSPVMGTWRPLEGTTPYIGKENEISEEEEYKVEVTIKKENLEKTMTAVKEIHPYEEPVIICHSSLRRRDWSSLLINDTVQTKIALSYKR